MNEDVPSIDAETAPAGPPSVSRDYAWLVESRRKVQRLLYDLLHVVEERPTLVRGATERLVFGLMSGAAFSLWRAVFFAEDSWQPPDVLQKTREFLENANAVSHGQESQTKAWMFGYFLNNARYRVIDIRDKLSEVRDANDVAQAEALRDFTDQATARPDELEPTAAWDKNFAALATAFQLFTGD